MPCILCPVCLALDTLHSISYSPFPEFLEMPGFLCPVYLALDTLYSISYSPSPEFLEMPGILSPLSCVSCPAYICAYVQRHMYIVRRRFQNFCHFLYKDDVILSLLLVLFTYSADVLRIFFFCQPRGTGPRLASE